LCAKNLSKLAEASLEKLTLPNAPNIRNKDKLLEAAGCAAIYAWDSRPGITQKIRKNKQKTFNKSKTEFISV